jgi:hypothetical protein
MTNVSVEPAESVAAKRRRVRERKPYGLGGRELETLDQALTWTDADRPVLSVASTLADRIEKLELSLGSGVWVNAQDAAKIRGAQVAEEAREREELFFELADKISQRHPTRSTYWVAGEINKRVQEGDFPEKYRVTGRSIYRILRRRS